MIRFKGFSLNPAAVLRRKKQFHEAQKYVDSEVLRRAEPYVPKKTGRLRQSGYEGTRIGSGTVQYTAPYARPRYYKGRAKRGLQGKFWFSRMKSDNKQKILSGAKENFK